MGAKLYTVHYPEEAGGSLTGLGDTAILVKQGFSWPAFLIAPLWLAYQRMWIVLALFLTLEVAVGSLLLYPWLPENAVVLIWWAVQLLLGFEGNNLYRWTLHRRRYRERGVAAGENLAAAEHRFFSAMAAGQRLP